MFSVLWNRLYYVMHPAAFLRNLTVAQWSRVHQSAFTSLCGSAQTAMVTLQSFHNFEVSFSGLNQVQALDHSSPRAS